jgi:hypothetical protein
MGEHAPGKLCSEAALLASTNKSIIDEIKHEKRH